MIEHDESDEHVETSRQGFPRRASSREVSGQEGCRGNTPSDARAEDARGQGGLVAVEKVEARAAKSVAGAAKSDVGAAALAKNSSNIFPVSGRSKRGRSNVTNIVQMMLFLENQ